MQVSFVKIDELSTPLISSYSAILGDNELTEFELFDALDLHTHENELAIIYNTIYVMRKNGVKQYYFNTNEGAADALPNPRDVPQFLKELNRNDFGVRLYCMRLTDTSVLLLNGGIKTKLDPLQCDNVKDHFRRAKKIAEKIDKLVRNNDLNLNIKDSLLEINFDI